MRQLITTTVGLVLLFAHTALGTYIDHFDDGVFDASIWDVVDQTGGAYYMSVELADKEGNST